MLSMFTVSLYIASVVGTMILSFFIFSRRADKRGLYFSIMSIFLSAWLLFQFAAIKFPSFVYLLTILGLIAFSFMPLFFYLFTVEFVHLEPKIKKSAVRLVKIITFAMVLLAIIPGTISEVTIKDGGLVVEAGIAYTIQTVLAVTIILLSILTFVRRFKRFTISERLASYYLVAGMLIALICNLVTGYIFATDAAVQFLGPLSVFIMASLVAYSITKHKLFDIRLIVARSLAYLLTVSSLVGIYALAISALSNKLSSGNKLQTSQQVLFTLMTLIFGFSLTPLKKFFDKLTNRLFYRDAYDAQELLDRLNKVLVGNIDLDVILKQTADILATTLKAEYVAFVIRETEGTSRRASFSKIVEINTEEILHITGKKKGKTELFVADEIEGDHDKIKSTLMNNNIAIAAKLAGSGDAADQGFLLLGAKQSGNPYNKQDVQVLDIIANELVIAIQNAVRFEEIETFNITLQQKVNDATKQLRQTNEKLKALDETKDEFISMASHQLRTPLTAVKGYVSMVVEGDAGKLTKQQKELLDQAFASSQRMVYLIADLLNVSRLKSGKFVIENKPTQLADVVESEMEQLTEVAKGKDQTLTYTKPDKFPVLMLDETKIRQVIMNFADNALHYTQNGGHIQINLEDKGDSIEYTVVDDGLGVPKAEQHHLFTKFYRAGNAKKARPDGTGLGLFMAKKVVVAQGGAIIFKSEEGKGSTFGFTFPKAKMLAPTPPRSKKS